ncbi:hypothetical protein [Mesorhizobium retamae]|uniref:Uncharacterized protein n=1 Tax=Mesorhizobium retamae TaxID=2912854 RepID=A0ABS9QG80_9HYPH|nr:hypothetical protein [Mesorhizobium sp. IRAMC:0171]MCG7506435.1 hypothetical protein [Mesorhizobium sp. IRAMC:0171]
MDTVTFKAKGISVSIDTAVGHIADLTIESGDRILKPLHRAPWIDEPQETLPLGLPDGVTRLSGDFLCAPFSRSDVEEAPLHGWPANSPWKLVDNSATTDGWRAVFRLQRPVMGATVEKIITLRDGHPFLYQEHAFIGGDGAISVAHHPMTIMREGGHLAFSPKRAIVTDANPLEPDPARGSYLLAYPARSEDLHHFPGRDGTVVDLADYRLDRRHEDFVTLIEADHGGPGWTAVSRIAEKDVVLVLKNPAELPITMLWISNGGRDYAPWNGRHRGVLGIEDGRTAVGHAASLGDNWLKREGIATAFELDPERRVAFRHVIGALAAGEGKVVGDVTASAGRLHVTSVGNVVLDAPYDAEFLGIGGGR